MRSYQRLMGVTVGAGASVSYVVPAGSYIEVRELLLLPSLAANTCNLIVVGLFSLQKTTAGLPTNAVSRFVLNTVVKAGETLTFVNTSAAATYQMAVTAVLVTPGPV